MSQDDQIRWNRQPAQSDGMEDPSSFLRQILESGSWDVRPATALDIACGKGRNALYLADRGFHVTAIDISAVALNSGRQQAQARSLSIDWQLADLEELRLKAAEYDLIVSINYLQRPLIPQIKAALKTGGHLIFETYLFDRRAIGHPENPAYLLTQNELLEHFREFRVLYYREGRFRDRGEPRFRAGILAQKIA